MLPAEPATLNTLCLITDGNGHRPAPLHADHGRHVAYSEAILPQIRATAMLMAAHRHDFRQRSPAVFTDEADWFAARILVLQVHAFHLSPDCKNLIAAANRRAREFAQRNSLPFQAACIRPVAVRRHNHFLIAECRLARQMLAATGSITADSSALCQNLGKFSLLLPKMP